MFFPLFDGHNKRRLLLLWAEFWLKIRPEFLKNSAATYYSDKIPNWEVKKYQKKPKCHTDTIFWYSATPPAREANGSGILEEFQKNPWPSEFFVRNSLKILLSSLFRLMFFRKKIEWVSIIALGYIQRAKVLNS